MQRLLDMAGPIALVLAAPDGSPLPRLTPGQYVWVAVTTPHPDDFRDDARNSLKYSLWTAPQPGNRRLTLQLAGGFNDGFAGEASDYLHYRVSDGDRLDVGVPTYSPTCLRLQD